MAGGLFADPSGNPRAMLIRRIARPLLSVAFIGQGVESLLNPKSAAQAAAPAVDGLQALPDPVARSIPNDPQTFAQITAAVQIGGGLLLATGKLPRLASAVLAVTVLPANFGSYSFWTETNPERKAALRREFLKDLSLVGGLLIAAADTAGKPSLGWRSRRAAERLSERVSSALPGSDDADLGELSERIAHGLQIGAERGRELASTAAERSAPYAEAALDRGREWANIAAERSAPYAEVALDRGRELASAAAERSAPLAKKARKRGEKFADELAEKAEKARKRSEKLADEAADRAAPLAKKARKRSEKLARKARDRGEELADTARAHGNQLAGAARERVGGQVKSPRAKLPF
ncbi:DoxX subfamily protein [Mycobacterium tuberculosis variant microti OV254]|nr:DoxX subfamily protein [Mycobacterium tuberculosis variant microti OV254]